MNNTNNNNDLQREDLLSQFQELITNNGYNKVIEDIKNTINEIISNGSNSNSNNTNINVDVEDNTNTDNTPRNKEDKNNSKKNKYTRYELINGIDTFIDDSNGEIYIIIDNKRISLKDYLNKNKNKKRNNNNKERDNNKKSLQGKNNELSSKVVGGGTYFNQK